MKNLFIILLILFATNLAAQPLLDIDADNDGLIEVSNLETLNAIRYQLNGSGLRMNAEAEKVTSGCAVGGCKGYELTGDLDFLDAASYKDITNLQLWTNGVGWQPIGDSEHPFNAVFKTNNSSTPHTIFNLTINRGSEDNVGLFGSIGDAAEISGIGLLDAQVTGRHRVGGLVGVNGGGQVSNSYASGHVVGSGGAVGLLVGSNSGAITNSYADGEVSGKDNSVGGLVGVNSGNLSNSYAMGNVVGEANNVGGLVGDNSQGTINNSYASASVSGSEDIGGLVGLSNLGTLVKNYVSGKATGIRYVGGLVGMNIGGTVSSSYWDKTASALEGNSGGVGLSTSELQSASAQNDDLNKPFYQWSTADWDFGSDEQYPILKYTTGTDANNPACGPEPSLPNCGSLLLGQHSSLKRIVLLADATLTPRFKPTQFNYHLNITPAIKQLQLIPIANNPNSIISISLSSTATVTDLASGTTSTAITLDADTELTIAVSAPNQRPAQYRLTVNYLPTITVTGIPDVAIDEGKLVILDASQSSDDEALSYHWTQSVGKALALEATDRPILIFRIPEDYVSEHATSAELEITVAVSDGKASASQDIRININKIDNGTVTVAAPTLSVTAWTAPKIDLSDDLDGVGGNLQYQWQSRISDEDAEWTDIDQATEQTYTPSILTAIGTEYRVRISYTDGQGYATILLGDAATYQPEIVTLDFAKAQAAEAESPPTTAFQCSTADIDHDDDGLIEICDLEGLNAMRYQLDGTGYKANAGATKITTGCADGGCNGYELMTDLDFMDDASYSSTSNKVIWTTGEGWQPIGDYKNFSDNKPFKAVFEGNHHTISNLMINRPDTSYVGLFSYIVSESRITNIGLLDVNVQGDGRVGGLVGYSYYGSITNSYAVGVVDGRNGVGGLVGYSWIGVITNSYAAGAVTGSSSVGGLVGESFLTSITNSYAAGAVTGSSSVGGLVGYNYGSITNSYAAGAVTGSSSVGGLVGSSYYSSSITNSYATGAVRGGSSVGGLVGESFGGSITNSYWDTATSGRTTSDGGTSKTTVELQQPTTPGAVPTDVYYGWSSDDWNFGTSSQYPVLKKSDGTLLSPELRYGLSRLRLAKGHLSPDFVSSVQSYVGSVVNSTSTIHLMPTALNPGAEISIETNGITEVIASGTTSNAISLRDDRTTRITLTVTNGGETTRTVEYTLYLQYHHYSGDVDEDDDGLIEIESLEGLNAIRYQPDGTGYRVGETVPKIMIGCPTTGCNGYELTADLSFVEVNNWLPIRLFSGTFEGNHYTISNLKINRPDTSDVGLFGSVLYGAKINNISLLNVNVRGKNSVGGLVGDSRGNITNSYAIGTVRGGSRIGGLVGDNGYNSSITNSYATSTVRGNWDTGGLVGFNSHGSITNSYATGTVRGNWNTGGLVGTISGGSITNSYAVGAVTGNNYAGGLVGGNYYASITNSYWDIQTSGRTSSEGGIGKTTARLQEPTGAIGIYSGWSGENWDFGSASQYPAIKYAASTDTDDPACGTLGQPTCGTLLPGQYPSLLDDLAVMNGTLSPNFDPHTFIYNVEVNFDVNALALSTTATNASIRIYSNLTPTAITDNNTAHAKMPLTIAGTTVITIEVTKGSLRPAPYQLHVTHDPGDQDNLPVVEIEIEEELDEGDTIIPQITKVSSEDTIIYQWYQITPPSTQLVSTQNYTIPADFVETGNEQQLELLFGARNQHGIGYPIEREIEVTVHKINNGAAEVAAVLKGSDIRADITEDDPDGGIQPDSLSYQWQRWDNDWQDIVGANMQNYTVPAGTTDTTRYRVRLNYEDRQGYRHMDMDQILSPAFIYRDIDVDDDGLIEIQYLEELDAMRYQLDGTGYRASAGATKITAGCATGGCDGYELMTDLDFLDDASYSSTSNKVIWTTGAGWQPIGGFRASFEGNDHIISNLMINRPRTNYLGLFSRTASASRITNIGLLNVNIQGYWYVGGLVSVSRGDITNSYAVGVVDGRNSVGGLVGYSSGSIKSSYATGTVRGGSSVGGLVGYSRSSITNSYAAGAVRGSSRVGGLVGWSDGGITNSYATGAVSGDYWVGGLVGWSDGDITNSYATGAVRGSSRVGGLVGWSDGGITNSYWDTATSGITNSTGGTSKTTVELQQPTTPGAVPTDVYYGWSSDDWNFGTSSQYPVLKKSDGTLLSPELRYGLSRLRLAKGHLSPDFVSSVQSYVGSVVNSTSTIHLMPTALNPGAEISIETNGITEVIASGTTSNAISLRDDRTTRITLTVTNGGETTRTVEYTLYLQYHHYSGDVDEDDDGLIEIESLEGLNAIRYQPDGTGYRVGETVPKIMIGCPTTGCNGYELTADLSLASVRNWSPIIFFAGTFEGNRYTISNLKINRPDTDYVGLFGYVLYGAKINNIGLLNINVRGKDSVGGLVGFSDGNITNSYATGAVTGNSYVGGLVGSSSRGSITNSYATSVVRGRSWSAGGLVGFSDSNITNSYATGAVTGDSRVGGLVGVSPGGSITNSYATGAVRGRLWNASGLVYSRDSISNSYWDTETSGITSSRGGRGKTTAELQEPTDATGIYSNWSSNDWDFGSASQYPAIKYAASTDTDDPACGTLGQPTCGTLLPGQYPSLLDDLAVMNGTLSPNFDPHTFIYNVEVNFDVNALALSTTATNASIRIYSNLTPTAITDNNTAHAKMPLTIAGTTVITIEVTKGSLRPAPYQLHVTHDPGDENNLPVVEIEIEEELDEGDTIIAEIRKGLEGTIYQWYQITPSSTQLVFTKDYTIPADFVETGNAQQLELLFGARNQHGIGYPIEREIEVTVRKINNGAAEVAAVFKGSDIRVDITEDDPDGGIQPDSLSYQWQRWDNDWQDIVGANMQNYTVPAGTTDTTRYRVRLNYEDRQGYRHMDMDQILSPAFIYRDIDVDDDGLIEISTLEELNAVRYQLDGTGYKENDDADEFTTGCPADGCKGYELVTDLDFNDDDSYSSTSNKVLWTTGAGWQPIGDINYEFSGVFKGNGHTISNLTIDRDDLDHVGLFAKVTTGGVIDGIDLSKVNIRGQDNIGTLVGTNEGGTITHISVDGMVSGVGDGIGGLVGLNGGSIEKSYSAARVIGESTDSMGDYVGGLVGMNSGLVTDSYARGSVSGRFHVGGLVGRHGENEIMNSYATADVQSTTLGVTIGGLVGSQHAGAMITNSYWQTRDGFSPSNNYGDGLSAEQLQLPTAATGIYDGWDAAVWDFGTSAQYPVLKYRSNKCSQANPPDYCGDLLAGQRIGLQSLELSRGAILVEEFASDQFNYTVLTDRAPQNIQTTATAASPDAKISTDRSMDDEEITITVAANKRTVRYTLAVERLTVEIRYGNMVITEHTFAEGERVDLKASLITTHDPNDLKLHYRWSQSPAGEGLLASVEASDLYFTVPADYVEGNTSSTDVTLRHEMTISKGNRQLKLSAEVTLTINKENNDTITTAEIGKPSLNDLQITVPDLSSILSLDSDGVNANPMIGHQWQRWKSTEEWEEIANATDNVYQVPTETEDETRYRVLISYTDGQGYENTTASGSITFIDIDRDNNDLIEVHTAEQLNAIRHRLDGRGYSSSGTTTITLGCPVSGCNGYELKAHIDLSELDGDWQPLGSDTDPFNAIFEGNHYTISNLTINSTATDYIGLFAATTASAVIRNVGLLDVNINANNNVGGLVGSNAGTIAYSHVTGERIEGNSAVGGLVGYNTHKVTTSHAIVTEVVGRAGGGSDIGGLIGRSIAGVITHSYAKVDYMEVKGESVCENGGSLSDKLIGLDDGNTIIESAMVGDCMN